MWGEYRPRLCRAPGTGKFIAGLRLEALPAEVVKRPLLDDEPEPMIALLVDPGGASSRSRAGVACATGAGRELVPRRLYAGDASRSSQRGIELGAGGVPERDQLSVEAPAPQARCCPPRVAVDQGASVRHPTEPRCARLPDPGGDRAGAARLPGPAARPRRHSQTPRSDAFKLSHPQGAVLRRSARQPWRSGSYAVEDVVDDDTAGPRRQDKSPSGGVQASS